MEDKKAAHYSVTEVSTVSAFKDFDSVVVVTHCLTTLPKELDSLKALLTKHAEADKSASKTLATTVLPIDASVIPGGRVVFVHTGPVNRDFDDVRRFSEAAETAAKKVIAIESKRPLLVLPSHPSFEKVELTTLLGFLAGFYTPLEIREAKPDTARKVDKVGAWMSDANKCKSIVHVATALECGRACARDIAGTDPVRMAPPRAAEYVAEMFRDTTVKVNVIKDQKAILKEYPLVAAVNRACNEVPHFEARVVQLTYEGEGPIEETLMFVGKGVTFDSGGMDVKISGNMVGMHRDKGGAAVVAGFVKVASILKPRGIKIVAALPFVRNAIGPDAYTCDEIITARSGQRVRVFNTDAEGRMIMLDPLCWMKEQALSEKNPHIFTVATLTGHAVRCVGEGYAIVLDNGPAKKAGFGAKIKQAGESVADMFDVSEIRREDYESADGKSVYEDVQQLSTSAPSVATPRGHQFAAAFLIKGSGLDKHGNDGEKPIRYSHFDIAANEGAYPGLPWARQIPAWTVNFLLNRLGKTN